MAKPVRNNASVTPNCCPKKSFCAVVTLECFFRAILTRRLFKAAQLILSQIERQSIPVHFY